MALMVPPHVQDEMLRASASAALDIQDKLQRGCNCCGWAGDRELAVRVLPKDRGVGLAVLLVPTGERPRPTIMYRTDKQQPDNPYTLDHRVIDYFREARINFENRQMLLEAVEAHDAKVAKDKAKEEAALVYGLSQSAGKHLREQGIITKKHKIDKKKDK